MLIGLPGVSESPGVMQIREGLQGLRWCISSVVEASRVALVMSAAGYLEAG